MVFDLIEIMTNLSIQQLSEPAKTDLLDLDEALHND